VLAVTADRNCSAVSAVAFDCQQIWPNLFEFGSAPAESTKCANTSIYSGIYCKGVLVITQYMKGQVC
jgi:hypothetical protein